MTRSAQLNKPIFEVPWHFVKSRSTVFTKWLLMGGALICVGAKKVLTVFVATATFTCRHNYSTNKNIFINQLLNRIDHRVQLQSHLKCSRMK